MARTAHLPLALVLCSFAFLSVAPAVSQIPAGQPLDPGRTVHREIRGGDGHVYEVSLLPGQYAQIRLDIKGPVDLVARLINSAGQPMRGVFPTGRTYAPTMGYFIADAPGIYRILVTPIQPPLDVSTYDITLEEVRPATDKDRALIAAVDGWSAASSEAGQALVRQDAPGAVAAHKKMLDLTEKIDKRDAIYSLTFVLSNNIAQRLVSFQQAALAESLLLDTVAFFDRVLGPDDFITVEMVAVVYDFYLAQGRVEDRRPLMDRLIAMTRRDLSENDPARVAVLHMRVGEYLREQRQYEDSLASLTLAMSFLSRAEGFRNVPATQVRVLLARGNVLWLVGRPSEALPTLNEALAVLGKNSDIANAASYRDRIDYQIGIAHMRLGDVKSAKPILEAAVALPTLSAAGLRDRLMALSRLRMLERDGTPALNLTLTAADIVRETSLELKRIAGGANADHKAAIRAMLDEAPETENSKEVRKALGL
jgi:tetratricopeptide (TPR) repeat protein